MTNPFFQDLGVDADQTFQDLGINNRSLLYQGTEIQPKTIVKHKGFTSYSGGDFVYQELIDTYTANVPLDSLSALPPEAFEVYNNNWAIAVDGISKVARLITKPVSNRVRRSLTFVVPSDVPSAFCGQSNSALTFTSKTQNGVDDYGNMAFTESNLVINAMLVTLGNTATKTDFGVDLKSNQVAGYFVSPAFPQVAIGQVAEMLITGSQSSIRGRVTITSFVISTSGYGALPFKGFRGDIEFY